MIANPHQRATLLPVSMLTAAAVTAMPTCSWMIPLLWLALLLGWDSL